MTLFGRAALGALCLAVATPAFAASLSTHVLDPAQWIAGRGVPGMLGFAGRTV